MLYLANSFDPSVRMGGGLCTATSTIALRAVERERPRNDVLHRASVVLFRGDVVLFILHDVSFRGDVVFFMLRDVLYRGDAAFSILHDVSFRADAVFSILHDVSFRGDVVFPILQDVLPRRDVVFFVLHAVVSRLHVVFSEQQGGCSNIDDVLPRPAVVSVSSEVGRRLEAAESLEPHGGPSFVVIAGTPG